MRRPTRIEFRPEDILAIPVAEEVLEQRNGENMMAWGDLRKTQGPTVSMAIDGTVYACGGFAVILKGTAGLWATVHVACPPGVLFEIRLQIHEWMRDYSLGRMQAVTPAAWTKGRRFLEWLGMDYEGTMRKYGPNGIDQAVYARVR